MAKRVFVVHGWDGYPEEGWFPWLKKELEARGLDIFVPSMPNTSAPEIEDWTSHLSKVVGHVDESTFFVGHSIGCQTILRYLEKLSNNEKAGGGVFVAGWFTLTNLETEDEKRIAKPWLGTSIDLAKVKSHLPKSVAIFSDNDPFVLLDNQDDFRDKLGAKIVIEKRKGHFSGPTDHCFELPSVLAAVLEISL